MPSINDGAAAVTLMSNIEAEKQRLRKWFQLSLGLVVVLTQL